MTKLPRILAAVLALALCGAISAQSTAPKHDEWISGHGVLAIQAAIPELRKNGRHVDDYYVVVRYEKSATWVIFSEGDMALATEAGSPGGGGFEVMLNKDDLTVIRSQFSR